jgi:hypothetical protein
MMTCVFAGFCRTSWQRDLSVSYDRVGDVLVAQGNLPEALKSFRDGLAIAERLAQADRGNAGWQFDFVVSHWKLAANGDDAPRRWAFIVATLRKLKAEFRLTPVQEKWLLESEGQLEKRPAARPYRLRTRPLSPSLRPAHPTCAAVRATLADAEVAQAPARRHTVKVAVDVEHEHHPRMIARPADIKRLNVDEAKPIEVKPVDKCVDSPHRIVLTYVLVKTRREQGHLLAINSLHEARHRFPAANQPRRS